MGESCHDRHTQSNSFPNAKLAEDRVGQIFRRRFATDFADGVDDDAQIKFGEI
jgi:hypothetical protein